jgi:hypothetical protein
MDVWLEPWGDLVQAAPGAVLEVRAVGPKGDLLEIEVSEDKWTIYAWSGALLEVHSDGRKIFGTGVPAP